MVAKCKILNLISYVNITPKCVLVHFGFQYILSKFEQFYHGETGQPSNERGLVVTNSEWVH
jgi:hypothetical protein